MGATVELTVASGAYLTDGHRLLKVLDCHSEFVLLEDAGYDDGDSPVFWVFWVPVRDVLGWRRVQPEAG